MILIPELSLGNKEFCMMQPLVFVWLHNHQVKIMTHYKSHQYVVKFLFGLRNHLLSPISRKKMFVDTYNKYNTSLALC